MVYGQNASDSDPLSKLPSHFENGRDVTVYFMLDRTEMCAMLSGHRKWARDYKKAQLECLSSSRDALWHHIQSQSGEKVVFWLTFSNYCDELISSDGCCWIGLDVENVSCVIISVMSLSFSPLWKQTWTFRWETSHFSWCINFLVYILKLCSPL